MGLPNSRPDREVSDAYGLLRKMQRSGMELFPLGIRSKMPRDKGFLLHKYDIKWAAWLKRYGNIGVRARSVDLIIDVDPKNGGLESFDALQWDTDLDIDAYPMTRTGRGNGGFHLYMAKPADLRLRWHVKGLPGLDFQSLGRYVVSPGSIHPETNLPYTMEAWADPPAAPDALLKMLTKPERKRPTGADVGELKLEELALILDHLDAEDFGRGGKHHDEWLDMAMAAHEATAGEGMDLWLDWCAKDPAYPDAAAANMARWDSFDRDGGEGAVTYRTLLRALARAGQASLVARLHPLSIGAAEDFKAMGTMDANKAWAASSVFTSDEDDVRAFVAEQY